MDDLPPYVERLLKEQRIASSQLPGAARELLRPLFDGGVLQRAMSGRGEVVSVANAEAFARWIDRQFPSATGSWSALDNTPRALAVSQRRNSKAARRGVVQSVLLLRAPQDADARVMIDGTSLSVGRLTEVHGVAATLIGGASQLQFSGAVALVENLELFLNAESVLESAFVLLNSAGRISERLIGCLARANGGTLSLLHLPDYDPVGLSDYLRLRDALGGRVGLFLPTDLEKRFRELGSRDLLTKKPRNRRLFETLGAVTWPCAASARVFRLIQETGCGLEQESLLLRSATF